MKGFKTLGFNLLVAAGAAILPILASTDWTAYVSPTLAMLIVTGVNIALRFITTTPVMSGK
jgi:hypothetical protein